MKKICISLLLIMSMLPSFVYAQSDYTQEDNSKFTERIKMLSAFGVLNGVELGDMNSTVSRVDFFKIVSNILGTTNSYYKSKTSFSDLKNDEAGMNAVNALVDLGYISGYSDKTIRPNESIKYEDVIKILVCLLGYETIAAENGGYYTGYMIVANQLGIAKKIEGYVSYPINSNSLVQMIVNCLEIDMMFKTDNHDRYEIIKGRCLFSEYLKLEKNTGKVEGNEFTHLTKELNYKKNRLIVNAVEFITNNNYNELLGCNITYYTTINSDEDLLVFAKINSGSNKVVTLDSAKITDYKDRVYEYDETNNDKIKKYIVELGAYIIINGRMIKSYSEDDLKPEFGKITLIDSDSNGSYEMVKINSYTNFVVFKIDLNSGFIYDKFDFNKKLHIDINSTNNYLNIIDEKGKVVSLKKITALNVLTVSQSRDEIVTNIIVGNNYLEGEVKEIAYDDSDIDYIVVDEKRYTIAESVRKNVALKVGCYGKFYLNAEGIIIAFDNDSETIESKFAYLIDGDIKKSVANTLQLKLFDQTDKILILDAADKVEIDHVKYKNGSETLTALQVSGVVKSQPIIYTCNAKGEIIQIDTADNNNKSIGFRKTLSSDGVKKMYRGSQMNFSGLANISEKTVVFTIPTFPKTAEDKYFSVAKSNYFQHDHRYNVETYGVGIETIIADLLINIEDEDGLDEEIGVITKISEVYDPEESKNAVCLNIDNSTGGNVILAFDELMKLDANIGDVVVYKKNSRNQLVSLNRIVNINKDNSINLNFTNPSNIYEAYDRYIYGSVYDRQGNIIAVTLGDVNTANVVTEGHNVPGYRIYLVTTYGNKTTVQNSSISDIFDYKHCGDEYSKVFISTRYGEPRFMVIYKNE